jgi:hypothetical protein
MLFRRLAIAILFVAVCVPIAVAGTIHYTITFSGGSILPAAGSFNYDPDSPHFTDFIVQWDNETFDLTESANAPLISQYYDTDPWFQGKTGAAATFRMLSCSSSPCNGWTVFWHGANSPINYPGWGRFEFEAFGPQSQLINVAWNSTHHDTTYGTWYYANGTWSIVPEPSLMLLLGLGLGSVCLAGWRRRK